MSLYQVQQCLFDYLRAMENADTSTKPEIRITGYQLTEPEVEALRSSDVGTLAAMGVHPVIINGYCRALGFKRADYRALLAEAVPHTPRRTRWQTS